MGARTCAGWAGVRLRAGVGVPVRACRGVGMGAGVSLRVYLWVFVLVRGCPGVRWCLFFLGWNVVFSDVFIFLLIPVCFSITRATTQITLITAHHVRIPSQPWGYFFCFLGVFLTVPGPGSRTDTDVDVEV